MSTVSYSNHQPAMNVINVFISRIIIVSRRTVMIGGMSLSELFSLVPRLSAPDYSLTTPSDSLIAARITVEMRTGLQAR